MEVIIIFIGIIIGLNCIPLLTKATFPRVENVVVKMLIGATTFFLIFGLLGLNGYTLKGVYSYPAISWALIVSIISYFVIFKTTKKKVLNVFILTPLLFTCLLTLILREHIYERQLDENYKISVTARGFLECGESINITQTSFIIFDKDIFYFENLCLIGINKIEIIKFDDENADFLIYHNGEYDSENPYKYQTKRKGIW